MKKLKTIDPVSTQPSVCGSDMGGDGVSPMDPPDAYAPPAKGQVEVEDMHPFLQSLAKEHDEIKERLEEVGRREAAEMERYVPILGTVASVAPLLGLLGTVGGMILTFQVIQSQGTVTNVGDFAGGISQALSPLLRG